MNSTRIKDRRHGQLNSVWLMLPSWAHRNREMGSPPLDDRDLRSYVSGVSSVQMPWLGRMPGHYMAVAFSMICGVVGFVAAALFALSIDAKQPAESRKNLRWLLLWLAGAHGTGLGASVWLDKYPAAFLYGFCGMFLLFGIPAWLGRPTFLRPSGTTRSIRKKTGSNP